MKLHQVGQANEISKTLGSSQSLLTKLKRMKSADKLSDVLLCAEEKDKLGERLSVGSIERELGSRPGTLDKMLIEALTALTTDRIAHLKAELAKLGVEVDD